MLDATSLLLVEDDEAFGERLARAFTARGLEVRRARTAIDAERLATDDPPELVVLDLRIGSDNGLGLISV